MIKKALIVEDDPHVLGYIEDTLCSLNDLVKDGLVEYVRQGQDGYYRLCSGSAHLKTARPADWIPVGTEPKIFM